MFARAAFLTAVSLGAWSCSQGGKDPTATQRDGVCGDSVCEANETSSSCPADCLVLNFCGDGACFPEEYFTCPADCGSVWFPIGPSPIDRTVSGNVSLVSNLTAAGRSTIVAVNPQNSSDVWLGTAGGGLWHSTVAGRTLKDTSMGAMTPTLKSQDPKWEPMTDSMPSLAIGALELVDCGPARCNTILAGTGENSIRRQTYYGAGLIIGEWDDGGEVGQGHYVFSPFASEHFKFGSVQDLVYMAGDNSVYVALGSGVTAAKAGDTRLAPEPTLAPYGLHKCLLGGTDNPMTPEDERCSLVLALPSSDGEAGTPGDLEFDGHRMWLGIYDRGILRSEPDDFTHWCYLNPGITQHDSCPSDPRPADPALNKLPVSATFDHVELVVGQNPQNLWAIFGNCTANRTLVNCKPPVFKSTDGGANWLIPVNGMTPLAMRSTYSRYLHALAVHPEDDSIVYSGGTEGMAMSVGNAAFVAVSPATIHGDFQDVAIVTAAQRASQDAAAHTACAANAACNTCMTAPTPPPSCEADQLCLRTPAPAGCPVADLTKDLIYGSTDGGLYFGEFAKGSSAGSWLSDNEGLVTTQLFGIGASAIPVAGAMAGTVPQTAILAGAQDNGPMQFQGTALWHLLGSGDGGDGTVLSDGRMVSTVYDSFQVGTGALGVDTNLPQVAEGMTMVDPSDSTRASFYQPHAVTASSAFSGGLYYATDRVYTAPTFDVGTTPISPFFVDTASGTSPPELGRKDGTITALAVSNGATPRVWVGLYNGKIFVSNSGAPSTDIANWKEVTTADMPKVTVSHIDLEPANGIKAHVSFSGFDATKSMVWKTDNIDNADPALRWSAVSGLPPNEPVKVVKLDTRANNTLWAGTDHGLFTKVGDAPWGKSNTVGLPNVPIFDIEFDALSNRAYVATHGRGAWMQTVAPQVTSDEGWVNDEIWDIPVSGSAFSCSTESCSCEMEVLLQDGTTCAGPSSKDADDPSGDIQVFKRTDNSTYLATQNMSSWAGKPVAWACRSGHCLPGPSGTRVDIALCRLDPTNKIAAVKVKCSQNDAVLVPVRGAPQLDRPPSSIFGLDPPPANPSPRIVAVDDNTVAAHKPNKAPLAALEEPEAQAMVIGQPANFTIIPTMLASAANGGERSLCSAQVELDGGEDSAELEEILADAINSSTECAGVGVTANPNPDGPGHPEEEDKFPRGAEFSVSPPPGMIGSQLVLAVVAAPGEVTDLCFTLKGLGNPALNQLRIMETRFLTGPGGALGGSITFSEVSKIGVCENRITTTPGETAEQIAEALESAFMALGLPGPLSCPPSQNPRDVERASAPDSVVSVLAHTLQVCIHDAGVGVHIGPEGVPLQPPVAICNSPTLDANASCQASVTLADLDGGSYDPDGPAPDCTASSTGPFGLGPHSVTLTCTDSTGLSSECTSIVTVEDVTPPTLTCPVAVSVPCTSSSGAVATFSTTRSDNCSGVGTVTCTPASGSTFPLGPRLDTCTVADASGNTASCNFYVTVALGDSSSCCPSGTNVMLGTSNNDVLTGTSGRDCILGRGGQDTINGNGSNDVISGGEGNDTISGGTGDDLIFGGPSQDTIRGDAGNDVMSGGDGDDQCLGGDGNDLLLGGNNQDRILGEIGDDTLVGEGGDDRLEGGAGNDSLTGSGLHDVCIGGPDTDTFLTCESQTQ